MLSNSGADYILSRSTRVWKVRIEDGVTTGELVALKDTWVVSTRHKEGYIHLQVMGSDYLSEGRPQDQAFFTTTQVHGDVFVQNEQDCTLVLGLDVPAESVDSEATCSTPHPHAAIKSGPSCQIHCRIVYGEVWEPLGNLTSLRDIFLVLMDTLCGECQCMHIDRCQAFADALAGLAAMHRAGWAHRDVSTGNNWL